MPVGREDELGIAQPFIWFGRLHTTDQRRNSVPVKFKLASSKGLATFLKKRADAEVQAAEKGEEVSASVLVGRLPRVLMFRAMGNCLIRRADGAPGEAHGPSPERAPPPTHPRRAARLGTDGANRQRTRRARRASPRPPRRR
jgi:hypothetical protein